jgi:hypothetical protein
MLRFDLTIEQLIDLLEYRELRARGSLGWGGMPLPIANRLAMDARKLARMQAQTMFDELQRMAFDPEALQRASA